MTSVSQAWRSVIITVIIYPDTSRAAVEQDTKSAQLTPPSVSVRTHYNIRLHCLLSQPQKLPCYSYRSRRCSSVQVFAGRRICLHVWKTDLRVFTIVFFMQFRKRDNLTVGQ